MNLCKHTANLVLASSLASAFSFSVANNVFALEPIEAVKQDDTNRQKFYKRAEKSYKKSIELDPRNADAHFALAELYRRMKKMDKAMNYYDKALAIRPSSKRYKTGFKLLCAQIGVLPKKMQISKDLNQAIKVYRQELPTVDKKSKQYLRYYLYLALRKADRIKEANEIFDKLSPIHQWQLMPRYGDFDKTLYRIEKRKREEA